MKPLASLLALGLCAGACLSAAAAPIMIERQGNFTVGGRVIDDPSDPAKTLHCDHGFVPGSYQRARYPTAVDRTACGLMPPPLC